MWNDVTEGLRAVQNRVGRAPVYHASQGVERADAIALHLRTIGEGFSGLMSVDPNLKQFAHAAGVVAKDSQQGEADLQRTIGDDDPSIYLSNALRATQRLGAEGQVLADSITTMDEALSEIRAIAARVGELATTYTQAHTAARSAAEALRPQQQIAVQQIDTYLS